MRVACRAQIKVELSGARTACCLLLLLRLLSLLLCHLLLNHDAPSIGCRCGNRCGEVQKRPCKLPCVKTPKAFCASSRSYILECDGGFAVCRNLNCCACNSGDKLSSLHFILLLRCFCCRSRGCKHWLVILPDWTWWNNNHPSWAVMHISLLCSFIYMHPCIVIFLFFLLHFYIPLFALSQLSWTLLSPGLAGVATDALHAGHWWKSVISCSTYAQ